MKKKHERGESYFTQWAAQFLLVLSSPGAGMLSAKEILLGSRLSIGETGVTLWLRK
jgi:hypothetical protein